MIEAAFLLTLAAACGRADYGTQGRRMTVEEPSDSEQDSLGTTVPVSPEDRPADPRPVKSATSAELARASIVYVLNASDLLKPGSASEFGAVELNDIEVWRGAVEFCADLPEVFEIRLNAPIPQSGRVRVRVKLGASSWSADADVKPLTSLEIRVVSRDRGLRLDWNDGYTYK